MKQIEDYTKRIALAMQVKRTDQHPVRREERDRIWIEANPRASRTVPFIAKAYDEPYVNYATKVMLGANKLNDLVST